MSVELGLRIKALRRLKLVTQQQLANRVNISVTQLSNIERGQKTPSADLLEIIAVQLNVSGNELFIMSQSERFEYTKTVGGRVDF